MLHQIGERQIATPLFRPPPTNGDQPAEPAVRRPIRCPNHDRRGVTQMQFGADDQLQSRLLGHDMGSHHPGEAVAIRHGDGAISTFPSGRQQFIGVRRPFEEGIVRFAVQFGVRDHSKLLRFATLRRSVRNIHASAKRNFYSKLPCRNQPPPTRSRNSQTRRPVVVSTR